MYFREIIIRLGIRPLKSMIGLVALLLIFGCQKQVDAGPMAPDFTLQDLSGNWISLEKHRGSVIILDFWATWCPPCRKSIPELISLQEKYRSKGLVVLAVSIDDPQKVSARYLRTFKDQFKINYKILRHNDKVIKDYFEGGQMSIPTQFIIDRKGIIRKKIIGFKKGAIELSLDGLLK